MMRSVRTVLLASFCSAARSLNAPVVTLTGGKAKLFKAGNPLVYGGAVKSVSGKPATGAQTSSSGGGGGMGLSLLLRQPASCASSSESEHPSTLTPEAVLTGSPTRTPRL